MNKSNKVKMNKFKILSVAFPRYPNERAGYRSKKGD
jgi:hypothetical protein